jgi:hypothetical protein
MIGATARTDTAACFASRVPPKLTFEFNVLRQYALALPARFCRAAARFAGERRSISKSPKEE